MARGGRRWARLENASVRRTAGPRGGTWKPWRRSSGPERAVDFLDVLVAQAAGGGLQAQVIGDGVVARDGKVALRGEELLLGVEHVDVDAHADFVAELVRVEGAARGHHGLLQRADLGDAVDH